MEADLSELSVVIPKRYSQNLKAFDKVNALISAMICPFESLLVECCVSRIIKQHAAQK